MQNINEIIEELNAEFPQWKETIKANDDFSTYEDDGLEKILYKLVITIKGICKERESDEIKLFEEFFDDKKIAETFQRYVKKTLIYFKAFRFMRKECYENRINVQDMLEDIFNNFVLRLDPGIQERYPAKTQEEQERFEKLLQAVNNLTDFYVKQLWIKKSVMEDFAEETGLSSEICKFYADLYETHFQELKLNTIMSQIEVNRTYLKHVEGLKH